MSMSGGIPWDDQKLGVTLADYLEGFRQGVSSYILKTGSFSVKDMDHNAERYGLYPGMSNKQASIAAVMLDQSCKGKDFFPDQFNVIWKAAFRG